MLSSFQGDLILFLVLLCVMACLVYLMMYVVFFFVEKKRCCFSAFLFGGTLRFRVRVTGVSLAALSATIVELR